MDKARPALHFAWWTYFWTLGMLSGFVLALRYDERWRHAGTDWTWYSLTGDLEGFWFLPLPIFAAALLAFSLTPRCWKVATLGLTPLLLTVWVCSPYRMPLGGIGSLMMLILPAALLASVPAFIRQRLNRQPLNHSRRPRLP